MLVSLSLLVSLLLLHQLSLFPFTFPQDFSFTASPFLPVSSFLHSPFPPLLHRSSVLKFCSPPLLGQAVVVGAHTAATPFFGGGMGGLLTYEEYLPTRTHIYACMHSPVREPFLPLSEPSQWWPLLLSPGEVSPAVSHYLQSLGSGCIIDAMTQNALSLLPGHAASHSGLHDESLRGDGTNATSSDSPDGQWAQMTPSITQQTACYDLTSAQPTGKSPLPALNQAQPSVRASVRCAI